MSTAAVARPRKPLAEMPWQLWASQMAAVLRIEIKKTLWMRRSIWIYLLAFASAVMFGIHALTSPMGRHCSIEEDTRVLAYTFQIFYLRVGIFFGCMGLFTWLFRGEIVEKSLHYYFLSPMRRELLVAGKFLAGFITASLVFASSVLLCFIFAYGHFGANGRAFVFNGPGLGQLTSYLFVTVLACLGFGAIFLAPSDFPSGKKGDVLTVEFTVAGVACLGLNGGPAFKHNEAFSFQIATDDQAETDRYWNAIVGNGGQESMCGWCKDKWGISWQITPRVLTEAMAAGGDEAKRAFDAMMGMKKIDVAAIKAARRG
jgi:predicted 3-demethylubiquinone-9 3-methyltransferase (glyoxalase superfamily)